MLILIALVLGFAFSQTKLCTVACIQSCVLERRADGLWRLAMATCCAAAVLLCAAWLWPRAVWLPEDTALTGRVLLGGALLGVGALVNGACYLGSITYLTTGNSNFFFTLVGIAAGSRLLPHPWGETMRMGRHFMGVLGWIALPLFGVMLAAALVRNRDTSRLRWATLATGVIAGLLFALQPDWSYGSVLDALAHADVRAIDWPANTPALALFVGAVSGAWLSDRFHLKKPAPVRILRCLAGGALLGFGAALIPGGNDTLLLWTLPGLALYGAAAFATMAAIIVAALLVSRAVAARRSTP